MGWYPAREPDNTVTDANLYFPGRSSDTFPKPYTKIKRWGKGHKEGPKKVPTFAKLAVENAMSLGWLNGKRLQRRK